MRFNVKHGDRYGTYINPDWNADEYDGVPEGTALVGDLILPTVWEAPEDELIDVDFKEVWAIQEREFAKAREIADQKDGVQVGAMFQLPVGDGFAAYVVTKVNKKTCDVEWRGFCADNWQDHHFGWGGRYPIAEVERYVSKSQRLREIFG